MITSQHWTDDGAPEGGQAFGNGFAIAWQRGPLGRYENRLAPNGAFVEEVIEACADRIAYYQQSPFACAENEAALEHLAAALDCLKSRTARREAAGTEGTHEGA